MKVISLWPHLSFQFFFIQWQPLLTHSSSMLSSRLCLALAAPGVSWARPCSALLTLSVWLYPQAGLLSLNSSSLFSLMVSFQVPVVCQAERWLLSLEDSFAPARPVVTELRALNLWLSPAGAFLNLIDAVLNHACVPVGCYLLVSPFSSGILFGGYL